MKEIARMFKSLEDETRLRIMGLLLGVPELCVCHIISVLQLPQSTVSRHLAVLRNAGWLTDRRAGVWIFYALTPAMDPARQTLVEALRAMVLENGTIKEDRKRLEQMGVLDCCPG